jgi:hypothetical protein
MLASRSDSLWGDGAKEKKLNDSITRRDFILAALASPVVAFAGSNAGVAGETSIATARLKDSEAESGGRLGVAMLYGASVIATYRGNERFPL